MTAPYYYGIVVGTSVDATRCGAVQAKILGITDDWKDDLQPWVYPQLGHGMQAVPQKGQYLLVSFLDGDINQGLYFGVSQGKGFYPDEYRENYPDVAYANLGELGFTYVHNRGTHVTRIRNAGNGGTVVWDQTGSIDISAESASSEAGQPSFGVLTEATIDVFTCRPVGDGSTMARAGSEYLRVSHISQNTVNTVRGGTSEPPQKTPDPPEMPTGGETRIIDGADRSYAVPYEPSPAVSPRNGNRTPKRILVGGTGGVQLSRMLESFVDEGAGMCTHYLVGTGDGDPDVLTTLQDLSTAKNRGFIQFCEIKDDTKFGSDMFGSVNVGAVTVMFYTDMAGALPSKEYAFGKLKDIISHVKKAYGLDSIEVVAYTGAVLDYNTLKEFEGEY